MLYACPTRFVPHSEPISPACTTHSAQRITHPDPQRWKPSIGRTLLASVLGIPKQHGQTSGCSAAPTLLNCATVSLEAKTATYQSRRFSSTKSRQIPITRTLGGETWPIFHTIKPGNDVGIILINGLSDRRAEFKEHAEHNVCQTEAIATNVGLVAD